IAGLGRGCASGSASDDAFTPRRHGRSRTPEDGSIKKAPSRTGGCGEVGRYFKAGCRRKITDGSAGTSDEAHREKSKRNAAPIKWQDFRINPNDIIGVARAERAEW